VKTGVYDPLDPASVEQREASPPTHEAEDVEQGVVWAMEREESLAAGPSMT
jgi:hypothetical protein